MTKPIAALLMLGLVWLGTAQPSNAAGAESEVRGFVEAFYEQYASTVMSGGTSDKVLNDRAGVLSRDLSRALAADRAAQAAAPGEIAGLDFDPFSFSQDPCEHYDAREVLAQDSAYRINVYCRGGDGEMPDVIAIVAQQDGRWVFTNFEYPENGNLLEMLKQAAENRQ